MPLLDHSTPSLIGGVSQQDDSFIKPGKCSLQENAFSSHVEGLLKRHPTEHIAKLKAGTQADALLHTINRDTNERYVLIITASGIEAYDVDGTEVTVTDTTGGYGYLSGISAAARDFHVVTNNDYTFILNRTKNPVMTADTTAAAAAVGEGFVFVRQGNYKTTYTVSLKDASSTLLSVNTQTFDGVNTTVAGELQSIKTDDIAADLVTKINALSPAWAAIAQGSVIKISHTSAFTRFETTDSVGDSVLAAVHNEVPQVEGYLPTICTHGFRVRVVGGGDSTADDYYVEFVADGEPSPGSVVFGKGYWRESINYATPYKIDQDTMPHQLVRLADGTFEFSPITWGDRTVGDDTLLPDPSFIGNVSVSKTINDIFFFKDRMGLVSDENVILSEQGQYYNFWRTTMIDLLDTAPIDVGIAHTSVAVIHHAVPFQERLVLMSDNDQFVLSGGDVLSPRTVTVAAVLGFENLDTTAPVSTARGVYFPYKRGDFSGIREMYALGGDGDVFEADDITAAVPRYISGNALQISSSTLEDVLVILGDGARDRVYIYKYLWGGQEKLQSSWSTYTFGSGATVLSAEWIENTLYLVIQRTEGVFLEKMVISSRVTDPDKDYLTRLDRRIEKSDCVSVTYTQYTDQTVIGLPYDLESGETMRVVAKNGVIYRVLSTDAVSTPNTITVDTNISSDDFWVGQEYTMTYRFAQPLLTEGTNAGTRALSSPVMKLRKGYITYHSSGAFTVTVQIKNRSLYTYYFTGDGIGLPDKVVGELKLSDGVFRFPVAGRPREATIEVVSNSHLPCNLTSAEWETLYESKGQRYRA